MVRSLAAISTEDGSAIAVWRLRDFESNAGPSTLGHVDGVGDLDGSGGAVSVPGSRDLTVVPATGIPSGLAGNPWAATVDTSMTRSRGRRSVRAGARPAVVLECIGVDKSEQSTTALYGGPFFNAKSGDKQSLKKTCRP